MAVTLKVTGGGEFLGSATNLTEYSVTEDATPLAVSDTSGGTGTMQFTVVENERTHLLLDSEVELEDESNGRTTGRVASVSANRDIASVSADSRINALMFDTTTAPFTGTLIQAFTYYFGLAGLTTELSIDPTLTQTVVIPGFTGNLWEHLKQLCAVHDVEISLVSSNIVVRKVRLRDLEIHKNVEVSWDVSRGALAKEVEVYAYNSSYVTNGMVYPPGGVWTEDMQVLQADAGETVETEITLDASLVSIEQPTVAASVPRNYSGPSIYSVSGNDGLPIPAAQWTDGGGKLTVSIGEDTRSIKITLKGMKEPQYAPYRIAVSSGPSDYYSSLRLRGTGVVFDKELVTIPTGAAQERTTMDIGITVDSPFIQSKSAAISAAHRVAAMYAQPVRTINVQSPVVNRAGDKGTANYPTLADFNALYAGQTFAQFNTANTGKTFAQFNAPLIASVQDDFDNQAFGNVAGGRVKYRDANYRVRTATTSQAGIAYSAEADTTFEDFNEVWTGKTFADFNAEWAGRTFSEFSLEPLWQE